jgi:hypothetical protein
LHGRKELFDVVDNLGTTLAAAKERTAPENDAVDAGCAVRGRAAPR